MGHTECEEGEGGDCMVDGIVTVGEVSANNGVRYMHRSMNVAVEDLEHAALVAVDSRGGTLFGWDDLLVACIVNHSLGEDYLLQPVEIGFKETDGSKLVDVYASEFFFEEYCDSVGPSLVWNTRL